MVIFDHPDTDYSDYGILTEEHFDAIEKFWNYVNDNPSKHGTVKATAAYVYLRTLVSDSAVPTITFGGCGAPTRMSEWKRFGATLTSY